MLLMRGRNNNNSTIEVIIGSKEEMEATVGYDRFILDTITQGVSFEQLLWLKHPIFSPLHPFPFLRIPFLQPSL